MASEEDFENWGVWISHMVTRRDVNVMGPTPMVRRALGALPKKPNRLWSVTQLAPGTGRDTRALLADPRIGTLTAYDGADMAHHVLADIGYTMLGGESSRLVGVQSPFEELDIAALPKVNMVYASAGLSYVVPDRFEDVTRGVLNSVKLNGIASVSFMAHSSPGGFGDFPTTGVDAVTLGTWLTDAGFSGSIRPFGPYVRPLEPGQDPVMYEALVKRMRTRAVTDAGAVRVLE